MKITNPYSDKKKILANNINLKIIGCILKIDEVRNALRKIFSKRIKKSKKESFIVSGLKHRSKYENRIYKLNDGENIFLDNFIINEVVTVDRIEELISGLVKIKKKYRFISGLDLSNFDYVYKFQENIMATFNVRSSVNVGAIEFSESNELSKYVKYIYIRINSITSTLLSLQLQVKITEAYQEEINKIINKTPNSTKKLIIRKNLNKFDIRNWGIQTKPDIYCKQNEISDILVELKYRILSDLNKHIPLYFHEAKILAPSIEVYSTTNIKFNTETNNYLRYYGIERGENITYTNFDDKYEIYSDIFNNSKNKNSIKIVFNNKNEEQLVYTYEMKLEYIGRCIGEFLCISTFSKEFDRKLAGFKKYISRIIHNKNIDYKKIIELRLSLENAYSTLSILRQEINEEIYEENIEYILEVLNLEKKNFKNSTIDYVVRFAKENIEGSINKFREINEIIDRIINISTIKSNRKLTIITVILTIITTILTVLTIYVTPGNNLINILEDIFISIKEFVINNLSEYFF